MKEKELNYHKVIYSNMRRFLDGRGKFAREALQIPVTEKLYPDPVYCKEIKDALRIWMLLDSSSRFFELLRNALNRKDDFSNREYWEAVEVQVHRFRTDLQPIMLQSSNIYVRTIGTLALLPDRVVRRWLWHENVDFQTRESFLRRLTDAQYQSLRRHYHLLQQGTPEEELPCFTEGVQNKIWNIIRPTTKTENKMATKAAIAYDFLGMGMGFQLYPSLESDRTANRELATQFLSKSTDRGDFEVNKEEGGLYWLLYRSLRSNALYGADKHVELGNWICPGFWFTMIAWFAFAVVSPASLIIGGLLYALKGLVIWPLFAVGSVCPLALTIVGVKKACGDAYTEDYWRGVAVALGCVGVFGFLLIVFSILYKYPAFYVFVAGIVLLAPYEAASEKFFWQAPILGKLVPAVFLGVLAYDLYTKSLFFEFWWGVLLAALDYLAFLVSWVMDLVVKYGLKALLIIAVTAAYGGVLYLVWRISSWATAQIQEKISKSDARAYYYEYLMNGIPLALGAVVFLGWVWSFVSSGNLVMFVLLLVSLMSGPVFLFFSNLNNRSVKNQTQWMLVNTLPLQGYEIYPCFVQAIRMNRYWGDVRHFEVRKAMLYALIEKMVKLDYHGHTDFITACLIAVRNDEEVGRLEQFVASELFNRTYRLRPSRQLVQMILAGASEDVLGARILSERQQECVVVKPEKRYLPEGFLSDDWFEEYVIAPLKKFLSVLSWPLRMLWKGVVDLYSLWETFNEQCPQSPPRNRKAV